MKSCRLHGARSDVIGNLDEYNGHKYKWQKASQLAGIDDNISYTYDYTGLRSEKKVDGVTTRYVWAGGLLMAQIDDAGNTIAWSYNANGTMLGFTLNGESYFYIRNLQGDVVGIYNASGAVVVRYKYDIWGKLLDIWDVSEYNIGIINPIRYRGYYYDAETGYYYCQSRYYNPEWCRWISADAFMDTGVGIMGTNMYVYCLNDPVNLYDPVGTNPAAAVAAPAISAITIIQIVAVVGVTVLVTTFGITYFTNKSFKNAVDSAIVGVVNGTVEATADAIMKSYATLNRTTALAIVAIANTYAIATISIQASKLDLNKTVQEHLKLKKGSIKNAPLPSGGPSWDDLLKLTLAEIARRAKDNQTGYREIWKLLTDKRFNR